MSILYTDDCWPLDIFRFCIIYNSSSQYYRRRICKYVELFRIEYYEWDGIHAEEFSFYFIFIYSLIQYYRLYLIKLLLVTHEYSYFSCCDFETTVFGWTYDREGGAYTAHLQKNQHIQTILNQQYADWNYLLLIVDYHAWLQYLINELLVILFMLDTTMIWSWPFLSSVFRSKIQSFKRSKRSDCPFPRSNDQYCIRKDLN